MPSIRSDQKLFPEGRLVVMVKVRDSKGLLSPQYLSVVNDARSSADLRTLSELSYIKHDVRAARMRFADSRKGLHLLSLFVYSHLSGGTKIPSLPIEFNTQSRDALIER